MNRAPRSFDRLARVYRFLEFLAFGSMLEQTRFCFLGELSECRSILVLGEGDGRCLARLVELAPLAQVTCVDFSAAMLARAASRIKPADRPRVSFHQVDVLTAALPSGSHDAVVTLFFLDCFTSQQAAGLIRRITDILQPGACWLWADFRLPARGLARWRAQVWLKILYTFFRWQTGLPAHELPPAEELIANAGFVLDGQRDFEGGLLRSVVFRSQSLTVT
jgi:ubiquinone/menaquinone biosynthesis C-methylase UbiE